jgi:hypothetical protein
MNSGMNLRGKIESNGLVLIAVVTASIYWFFDTLIAGQLLPRILLALSICIYGIFTQFLIRSKTNATTALQEANEKLEQRTLQIETANRELEEINEKLEMAYSWMRDSRDELKTHMYEEDIGFLINREGQIEGITERALTYTSKSRDALMNSNIMQLLHESSRGDFERELPQAWRGITLHLKVRLLAARDPEKVFETKLTRITVSDKRLILVILR